MSLRALPPGLSAEALIASVDGAAAVRARELGRRRRLTPAREIPPPTPRKPRAAKPRAVAEALILTPYEQNLYGVLRVKHGMSPDQALAAIRRRKSAAPNASPRTSAKAIGRSPGIGRRWCAPSAATSPTAFSTLTRPRLVSQRRSPSLSKNSPNGAPPCGWWSRRLAALRLLIRAAWLRWKTTKPD